MYWGSFIFLFQGRIILWKSLLKGCDRLCRLRLLCWPQHWCSQALGASTWVIARVRGEHDDTKGWHSIDLCSHNLCRQTEHPSCCVGSVRTVRGRWSTCRRLHPLFSPPPPGWCSSRPRWSEGRDLWRMPVVKGETGLDIQTWNMPRKMSSFPVWVPVDAP